MKLKVYTLDVASKTFRYNYDFEITNAPEDADWNTLAVMAYGENFCLSCLSSSNTLYQFPYNGDTYNYQREVKILNIPKNAQLSTLSMFRTSTDDCLYFRDIDDPNRLYQFISREGEFVFSGSLLVKGADTDQTHYMAMSYDTEQCLYTLDAENEVLHEAIFSEADEEEEEMGCWFQNSGNSFEIDHNLDGNFSFAMAYAEGEHWMYFIDLPNSPQGGFGIINSEVEKVEEQSSQFGGFGKHPHQS